MSRAIPVSADHGDILSRIIIDLKTGFAGRVLADGVPRLHPANGDINGDGIYPSFDDINPFVALLSGGA